MGALISFFTGPLGKIAMYAIVALFLAGLIWAGVAHYDKIITENAYLKHANQQLMQTVADKEKEIQDTRDLLTLQSSSIDSLQQSIDDITKKYGTLEEYLNSQDAAKSDRPSSDILKETVRRLKELQK
jgi:hypothetical protein